MTIWRATGIVLISLTLSACGTSDRRADDGPGGKLRIVNAVPDASRLTAGPAADRTFFHGIAFGHASDFLRLPVSSYDLRISLRPADGGAPVRFRADRTTVDARHESTLYILGRLGDHSATSLLIETTDTPVPPHQARLRFIDAATGTPPISVYLLGNSADIGHPQALTSLEFPGGGTPIPVPAGDYELVLTAREDPADVLFDSGTSSLHLTGGSRTQIATLNAPDRPGGSPFQILVLDSRGTSGHMLRQNHP